MEQPGNLPRPEKAASFEGFLASLTSPKADDAERTSRSNEGELGEDVVTLSYEQALRSHVRYRADEREDWPRPAIDEERLNEAKAATPAMMQQSETARDVRNASITIRLSKAECAQLRRRAAETRLTVSAYLRSCVLEADALRAQVKEALAELKTAAGAESAASPARRSWMGWIGRVAKHER